MRLSRTAAFAAIAVLALAGCKQATTGGNSTATTTTTSTDNASATATAGSGINGTWKADVASAKWDQKPDQFLLQNGTYSCKTCTPPWSVQADGAFHPVTGHPYYDEVAIKVVDDKTVQQSTKLKGRDTGGSTIKVSADGNTLGIDFNDKTIANAPPSTGHVDESRVAAGPAGAHAISGAWKPSKAQNINIESLTITLKADPDMLHMSSPGGTSYDAKLDGTDTPIKGDPAGTMASVKKLSDNSYEETDKRAGKVVSVTTFTVGADGKLTGVSENKLDGSKFSWTANKA
ncbi:MAG TPA: hypothetical protein VGU01_12060 [Sphingomicrobium sp.]|nr:hypothetical protein [Sphingomicrobium sp.]